MGVDITIRRARVDTLENFLEAVWDWAEENDWVCELGRNELNMDGEAESIWDWAAYLRRPGMRLSPISLVPAETGMSIEDYRRKVWWKIGLAVANARKPLRRMV